MTSSTGIGPTLQALADLLRREAARGVESMAISHENLKRLGQLSLPKKMRSAQRSTSTQPTATRKTPTQPTAPPASPAQASISIPTTSLPSILSSPPISDESSRRDALNALYRQLKSATTPRDLGTLHDTIVFATGDPMASIVFVGEAPGEEEEKLKKPFVGPAGQKLDQILKAMEMARNQVYISNIVKFRPKIGDGRFQGSRNRAPSQEEMDTCLPFLHRELEIVRPKVIVALGRTAAEGLLGRGGSLASFRNTVHDFAGIPVIVTYHPSYLLRQESGPPAEARQSKRFVWEDMLKVMELAELSISAKQRSYFQ